MNRSCDQNPALPLAGTWDRPCPKKISAQLRHPTCDMWRRGTWDGPAQIRSPIGPGVSGPATSCSRSVAGPEEFPDLRQGCVPIIQSSSKSSRAHGLVLTVGLLNCLAAIKIVCFALSLTWKCQYLFDLSSKLKFLEHKNFYDFEEWHIINSDMCFDCHVLRIAL